MTEDPIPIRRPHPPTLAEGVTARLQTREQRRGNKAREACLAARFREAAANARAKRERPTNPCATWAERREARDDWEPQPADLDAPAP